jgi:hypothetical protein
LAKKRLNFRQWAISPKHGNPDKERTMYVSPNFKTKKALKEAVARGDPVKVFAPGLGAPRKDGKEWVEGPHYPEPHRWYAELLMKDGKIIKVK